VSASIFVLLLVVLAAVVFDVSGASSSSSGAGLRGFVNGRRATSGRAHWRPLTPAELDAHRVSDSAFEQPLIKAFVALKENSAGLRAVEAAVEAASDPTRADTYGRHLEWDELNALVAPTDTDVEQVKLWLERAGVERFEVLASGSWVRIEASADALHALVKCRLRSYTPRLRHDSTSKKVVIQRCEEEVYHIPHHLDHIVEFVSPIVGTLLPACMTPHGSYTLTHERAMRARRLPEAQRQEGPVQGTLRRPAEGSARRDACAPAPDVQHQHARGQPGRQQHPGRL
jgi:hypothetical protein